MSSKKHPNEIITTHVPEKVLKAIPEFVKEEMDTLGEEDLRKVVTQAHSAMKQAEDELAANEKYQQARQVVSDLSYTKKETNKYQKAKISYALARLEQIGKLDTASKYDLILALREAQEALVSKRMKAKTIVQVDDMGKVTTTDKDPVENDDTSSEEENS